MADTKISALTAASTPLAGTEVLPIVQSGATVKVAVSNLTAGRAVSASSLTASTGDITSTAGNFVVGTSGKGIDFSATPGTGTSELLADYEEGTWTPAASFSTSNGDLSYSKQVGRYVKNGSLVTVIGWLNFTETTASGNLSVTGLPFTSANITDLSAGGGLTGLNMTGLAGGCFWSILANSSTLNVFQGRTGDVGAITNTNTGAGSGFYFSCSYQAA